MITTFRLILAGLFIVLSLNPAFAQSSEKLSVEWIYSDARRSVEAIPRYQWLANNTALMFDSRKPEGERPFQILNPKNGKIKPATDIAAAQKSLATLRDKEDDLNMLRWPDALDAHGKHALFVIEDDLYLLNFKKSAFQRITATEAKEKSARFSPDGKKIAFVRNNDLYAYFIEDGSERRLTEGGSETVLNGTLSWVYWEEIFGRRDIGYWWSNDSKSIAFLQSDESAVTLMHYVDFEPVEPRLIKQRYPKAGTENPLVHIGLVDIDKPADPLWLEVGDFEYVIRVQWMNDNQRLAIQTMNRAQTDLKLLYVHRRTGKGNHILTESDPGWVNINDDLYFLKNSRHFLWQSERDGYAHLYRFNSAGKLENQITKGEWALRSSGGVFWMRQSVTAIDEEKEQVYFTALKKSSVERHLYRINFDGSGLTRISKADGVHRITFSPNGKYYFDNFSTHKTMPSLSLYDRSGKLKQVIAAPQTERLKAFNLQYPELFSIPAADGFAMPAEILKPADFDPNKKYPLIYYVYGGPSAPTVFNAWRGTSLYFDNLLLQQGYLVVRFDHRSATAISKILENRLAGMMSGPTEIEDIAAGIKWLKSQPYVDADRVAIWGWSGGGSFTLNAMTNTREFKAGIAVAAVTDWHYYDTKWAEFGMKRPQDNPEGYKKTSFIRSAKNLHGRLLLVHGTYDDNVHPQNAWRFIEEMIQHNIRFEMMFYPMRKHGIVDDPARIHLYNTMLEFWDRNL